MTERKYCYAKCRDPWFNECADCWQSGGNPPLLKKSYEPDPKPTPQAQEGQGQMIEGTAEAVSHHAEQIRTAKALKVIGAVSSGNIAAERDTVKATLERGIAENPTATWVTEPRSTMIRDLLLQLGVQPVVLPLQDEWKIKGGGDYRRTMRDGDLLRMCDPLLVFHKATGQSPWRSLAEAKPYASSKRRIHENLHLIELGKPKKKAK